MQPSAFEDRPPRPLPGEMSDYCRFFDVFPQSSESYIENLPFAPGDTTAGTENELQSAVIGQAADVDLAQVIATSNYLKNIRKRTLAGETPRQMAPDLENFIADNPTNIWENSWVRFPRSVLNDSAREVLNHDLLADKQQPQGPMRKDVHKFNIVQDGREMLRLPVSYLLKLSLAQAMGELPPEATPLRKMGLQLMSHFSNDNTSPETCSFYTPRLVKTRDGMGRSIAAETSLRYLVCQVLIQYANHCFALCTHGQEASLYMAPNPPIRQKKLNDLISDAFYRELFMSPCLSGWDRGEDKHHYMGLCHQVLSRSQLNAVAKLKEAQIINNNLVVLPNTSNVSLANNGTHLSLGSLKLSALLEDSKSGFGPADEKNMGDLVIKICEHFLPLFVGTYSAAPYRIDFTDFHPERVLGYLPHELDFTHLRMIWRRWKKKARLKILGRACTPFGPYPVDRFLQRCFRLKGDFVPDFRLLDYLICLKSTEESAALDGILDNDLRLKRDLSDLGVFDERMSLYLLYKQRQSHVMGFSGFEGRYYSQFESLNTDLSRAAGLQTLITVFACKSILNGSLSHKDIPSDSFTESERRQIFFATAIGLPTFYVNKKTKNRFLLRVLRSVKDMRFSRRYPGYLRVPNTSFHQALIRMLTDEAADLIELMGLEDTIEDLRKRIRFPEQRSVAGRLTAAILDKAGAQSPMDLDSNEFAGAAENYYRDDLRLKHMTEAMDFLAQEMNIIDGKTILNRGRYREILRSVLQDKDASRFVSAVKDDILRGTASVSVLERFLALCVMIMGMKIPLYRKLFDEPNENDGERIVSSPVCVS